MAKITGDLKKIIEFAKSISELDAKLFLHASAKAVYKAAEKGLSSRKNPYGRAWKKTKSGRPASTGMYGSIGITENKRSFVLNTAGIAAAAHNSGAKRRPKHKLTGKLLKSKAAIADASASGNLKRSGWRLPARRIFPSKKLPPAWWDEMEVEMGKAFMDAFKESK